MWAGGQGWCGPLAGPETEGSLTFRWCLRLEASSMYFLQPLKLAAWGNFLE